MAEEDNNGDGPTIVQLSNVQLAAVTSAATGQQQQQQQQQMVLNGNPTHSSIVPSTLANAEVFVESIESSRRDLASNGDHQGGGSFQQLSHATQNVLSSTVLLSNAQNSVNQNNFHGKSVCRDFLRNVCFRGAQCKFAHPGDSVHGDFVFCHDFQNLGCTRIDCKFVHASKEDERRYLESGKLPSTAANVIPAEANHEPICKDFLKRQCHRGRRCKFRHELSSGSAGEKGGSLAARDGTVAIYYDSNRLFQLDGEYGGGGGATNPLLLLRGTAGVDRDRWSPLTTRLSLVAPTHSQVAKRRRSSQGPLPSFEEEPLIASMGNLERENQMLRERLEDMQKQLKDLMSTNEFLLQQNAELRLSKQQVQAQVAQQAARACSAISGHAGAAVMSTAGAVISNNVQQQLASNVIPSSVLTSSVLQSVQSAANSLPAAVGPVGGCALPTGVLSSMPALSTALPGLASSLPSAVLGAPTGPITSEATVSLVPVSSIITMSSSSSNEQLVGGYPIVTSQGQLRYNPTRQ